MQMIKEQFEENGYAIIENFVSDDEIATLMGRTSFLVEQFDPSEVKSVFHSFFEEGKKASDQYILTSGDKIRFFLEAKALDENGDLKFSKHKSICKIGHALHDLDPVFSKFSRSSKFKDLAHEIGFESPLIAQSMYFFKHPKVSGEIQLHQDASFIYTEPSTVVGFWVALEDAYTENSCLWVLPKGHKLGLKSRFVRSDEGEKFEVFDTDEYPQEDFVPLEVKKGSLVLLHGHLPHYSSANLSEKSRHAYTLHLIDGNAHYPANNWLQRSENFPFQGF